MKRVTVLFLIFLLLAFSLMGCQSEGSGGDPFASVFQAFGLVLIVTLLGRFLARKLHLSLVLGEVVMGIILGVFLSVLERPVIVIIRHQSTIDRIIDKIDVDMVPLNEAVASVIETAPMSAAERGILQKTLDKGHAHEYVALVRILMLFSSFGILLLMFSVGLESNLTEIFKYGGPGVLIALSGMVVSTAFGYFLIVWLAPGSDPLVPWFVGGALSSSSIGLTAMVFKEMKKEGMPEFKALMSASVFDDVFGLVLLAILTSILTTGKFEMSGLFFILLKAVLFLGSIVLVGLFILPKAIRFIVKLDPENIRLLFPMILLMLMCWVADAVGLAMTIGAFGAGLIITEKLFATEERHLQTVEMLIAPIQGIFVPVFFVLMGLQVDVSLFADFKVLGIGLALTFVSILGKIGSGLFLPKGMSKWVVGMAMMPRGEFTLVFMSIGQAAGVIDSQFFAIVVMVILLTIALTPPALKWAFKRAGEQNLPASA